MEHSETIIVPSLFVMLGFIVWVLTTGWQRRQRMKLVTDFNARLLDRLGSVKDFSEFMQTEAGAQLMGTLASEPSVAGPPERILRAVQLGIVLMTLGGGLLFLGRSPSLEGHDAFNNLGVIALSLGAGFLLSSGASYWLAASLGVLHPSQLRAPRG